MYTSGMNLLQMLSTSGGPAGCLVVAAGCTPQLILPGNDLVFWLDPVSKDGTVCAQL